MKTADQIREKFAKLDKWGERAGMHNYYRCTSCGHSIITVLREDGVTPFMICCEECSGSMQSGGYPKSAQWMRASHEWVREEDEAQVRAHAKQAAQRAVDEMEIAGHIEPHENASVLESILADHVKQWADGVLGLRRIRAVQEGKN